MSKSNLTVILNGEQVFVMSSSGKAPACPSSMRRTS